MGNHRAKNSTESKRLTFYTDLPKKITLHAYKGRVLAKKGIISRIFGISKSPTKINVKELRKRVERNPKDLKAALKLGDYYKTKHRKNKAIEYYKKAADICIEDGFINKAIAIVKKIADLDKKNPDILLKLANLYMRQNLFGEAILHFQRVLELDPENAEAKETMEKLSGSPDEKKAIIEALRTEKEVKMAAKTTTLNDIITEAKDQIREQISTEDVIEHYDLGVAYMEMELYESAIEEFGITLNDPKFFEDSLHLIYECFFAMDRISDAITYFNSLLKRSNISPLQKETIRLYIGMAYEDSLETVKAIKIYEDLLNKGYSKSDTLVQRIDKLKHSDQLDSPA